MEKNKFHYNKFYQDKLEALVETELKDNLQRYENECIMFSVVKYFHFPEHDIERAHVLNLILDTCEYAGTIKTEKILRNPYVYRV
jgi:hypothetical protein